ncbi:hypothetical protein DSECCO2_272110 [anaerobic digester metagenome]
MIKIDIQSEKTLFHDLERLFHDLALEFGKFYDNIFRERWYKRLEKLGYYKSTLKGGNIMKKIKEVLRSSSVKLSAQMLCASASFFAIMMCHGKLYEPKVPERLKR